MKIKTATNCPYCKATLPMMADIPSLFQTQVITCSECEQRFVADFEVQVKTTTSRLAGCEDVLLTEMEQRADEEAEAARIKQLGVENNE